MRILFRKVDGQAEDYQDLKLKVNTMAVKIGIFSAVGATVGGGLVMFLVSLFRH